MWSLAEERSGRSPSPRAGSWFGTWHIAAVRHTHHFHSHHRLFSFLHFAALCLSCCISAWSPAFYSWLWLHCSFCFLLHLSLLHRFTPWNPFITRFISFTCTVSSILSLLLTLHSFTCLCFLLTCLLLHMFHTTLTTFFFPFTSHLPPPFLWPHPKHPPLIRAAVADLLPHSEADVLHTAGEAGRDRNGWGLCFCRATKL